MMYLKDVQKLQDINRNEAIRIKEYSVCEANGSDEGIDHYNPLKECLAVSTKLTLCKSWNPKFHP